ncbi:MAG: ABC transporter permease [Armatimonadetes bacterium]|nr:ABC transporter permease [Anaerolineae bacterium]
MANASIAGDGKIGIVRLEEKRKPQTLLQLTIKRFFRHRMAVVGMVILGFMLIYVIGGSFVYSEAYANDLDVTRKYEAPSFEHPFGLDGVGRDVLARTIYGGQISLTIGVVSVAIAITLGTLVGLVSGYYGGWIDNLLMRFVEAMLAIPTLILLLLLNRVLIGDISTFSFFGRQMSVTVIALILIIGLTGWLGLSRIVRSMVLSLKEQEFVVAARMVGASDSRIIFTHILPNCIAPIVVSATLGVGGAIVTETALGFLGFGVLPPTATWGNILSAARELVDEKPWMWMAPGALITLTVLSFNFIGDGLRDALDPRSLR